MNNFKMTLQYDGTRYLGWTKNEKSVKTVSYKLEQVLTRLLGQPVILHAAVRTEPGVHASCQVCSFEADLPFSPEVLKKQMNQYLPMDIKVLSLLPVSGRFRADLGIRAYTYEYNVCTASVYDVFHSRYQAHFFPAPDLALMKQAASCLIGKHDFQSFSPVRKKKGTKKELLYLDFIQNKEQLSFRLTANAFLPSMPQLIVGTLLEIGQGKRSPDCILSIFEGNETPRNFCPSDGLFLTEIQY